MKQKQLLIACLALLARLSVAQQVSDTAFTFTNPNPHAAQGQGSTVCLDEAHFNFHTLDGRYASFGKVLRDDGYRVQPNRAPFTAVALAGCKILVISNALDSASAGDKGWQLPTPSAFGADEIAAVNAWVRNGGRLFLIADHMPFAGSAQDLARSFGVKYENCFALDNRHRTPERFYRGNKSLLECPLTRDVDTVVTFTGSAFSLPKGAQPILALRDYTLLFPEVAWQFGETTPHRNSQGLYQLGYLQYGNGKVAVSGEAAMFSAQLSGPNRSPMGMNQPEARQNARLLLNLLHWLDE